MLVLGLDMFRAVQRRLDQPRRGRKISTVEVLDSTEEGRLSEMFQEIMKIADEEGGADELNDIRKEFIYDDR